MSLSKELAKILKRYSDEIGTPTWPLHVKGDIPSWIIDNALETFAKGMDRKTIVGFYDTSFNSNGKCGYIFTDDRIYYKQTLGTPMKLYYEDIKEIELGPRKSKETSRYMLFHKKNGETVRLFDTYLNKTPLKNFLEEVIQYIENADREENQKPIVVNKTNDIDLNAQRTELTARLNKLKNKF